MKFLHLSDLHIGKKLNGFSLLEDQVHILSQTLAIIDEYSPDAVIIAGDVYDKGFPPAAAVTVLDKFLTDVLKRGKLLFMVSGNHDSPERLSFGSEIMRANGIYIEGMYRGAPFAVELSDIYGKLNVFMLPFVNPAVVGAYHGESVETFNDAAALAISKTQINSDERNILIAHQFVTAEGSSPTRSDSELKYAGGIDNVNSSLFDNFDYVALGHLHCPQSVGRDTVVYCGSPLKYSISERMHKKSAVLVELREKGDVLIQRIPLEPLRDLLQIKGPLEALTSRQNSNDYISVVLTGGKRYLEPYKRLRAVYPNCISVEYEDEACDEGEDLYAPSEISQKSHIEIFEQFYFERTNERLNEGAHAYLQEILDEISDGGGL